MNRRLRSVLNVFGWCAAVLALLALVGVIAATSFYRQYERRAAQFDLTKIDQVAERSAILDANGDHYTYFGGENRFVVPLREVSKHFIDALLAREDARFWEHEGVDFWGILRAAATNVKAGETKQGASTITQQLARNACELKAKTLDRKALEAMLARRIEKDFTKEQILELYVNRIYFGSGYYGIETASRGYFAKSAKDLTLSEAAALAGLIRSPGRLSPANDVEASLKERNLVVDRMLELNFITAEAAAAAKAQQLELSKQNRMRIADDYISDAIHRELSSILAPETIEFGGLKVHMTVDPQLQRMAQEATDRQLSELEERKGYPHPKKKDFVPAAEGEPEKPTDYLQAAAVVVDNRTGAVRAIVGGRDYKQSKYSRALLSKRQIGSTYKPFVYAAAFEHGMMPGTLVDDSKIAPGEFRNIPKKWSPENSDGEYNGPQPAALGLLKSRNTMTVRVGQFAGLSRVRQLGVEAGISDSIPDLPVVFLGGFETTVRDLTGAYTIFPNLGVYRRTHIISSVEDRDGNVLWKADTGDKRVISPNSAWLTSSILQQVMKSGTAAKSASLGWKKIGAGKTGTTNDFYDAWFVGYTSSLTCGVWVGMDQPQTILEKGYGSALALPIWVDIMQRAPENLYPSGPLEPPEPMVKVAICSVSGARATSACVAQNCAYQTELPTSGVPTSKCQTHPEEPTQPVVIQPGMPPGQVGREPLPTPAVAPGSTGAPAIASTSLLPTPQPTPTPFTASQVPQAAPLPGETEVPGYNGPVASPSPQRELSPAALAAEAESLAEYRRSKGARRGARVRAAEPLPEVLPPIAEQTPSEVEAPDQMTPRRSSRAEQTSRRQRPSREPVQVRRATPVEADRADYQSADGSSERRIVQRMPDGRMRTTIIRRVPSRDDSGARSAPEPEVTEPVAQPAPRAKRKGIFGGDDDDDDDGDDD